MTKGNIEFSQFSLAPRRTTAEPEGGAIAHASSSDAETTGNEAPAGAGSEDVAAPLNEPLLQRLPEDKRREKAARRAGERQDARRTLKNLKRAKERNLRFYVNVPLEQDAKARLQRAAHENDVHMTVIMQAAIDTYLKDNGY